MTIAIVTDSSACLDPDVAQRRGIGVAPLHVLIGDQDYREGVDDIPVDLAGATTAGASPAELRAVYSRVLERQGVEGIVAVHISEPLSGTWVAARNAARDFDGRVRVVDSRSVAMGLGFAVLAAADEAERGGDLDSVAAVAERSAAQNRCLIVVDSLENLRRGGRVGAAAALLGTALSIKPVLHVHEGKLVVREKLRTSSKAFGKMVDAVADVAAEADDGTLVDIAVHHFRAVERGELMAERLGDRIGNVGDLIVRELNSVLGVHVGPGALAVVVSPRA